MGSLNSILFTCCADASGRVLSKKSTAAACDALRNRTCLCVGAHWTDRFAGFCGEADVAGRACLHAGATGSDLRVVAIGTHIHTHLDVRVGVRVHLYRNRSRAIGCADLVDGIAVLTSWAV